MSWPDVPHVTVPGSGTETGTPDVVGVTLTATGRGADPAEALVACGRMQDLALAELRAAGATDVAGTGIVVRDEWDHEHNRPGGPQATSELSATLPDVATAGDAVVRALAAAPDVRLHALTPRLRDPDVLVVPARASAFADARARAEQHAALAGQVLGPLLRLHEGGLPFEGTVRQSMSAGFEIPPVVYGISIAVEATWALVDPAD